MVFNVVKGKERFASVYAIAETLKQYARII